MNVRSVRGGLTLNLSHRGEEGEGGDESGGEHDEDGAVGEWLSGCVDEWMKMLVRMGRRFLLLICFVGHFRSASSFHGEGTKSLVLPMGPTLTPSAQCLRIRTSAGRHRRSRYIRV